ncbi:MAG TPA: hypothetical protein PK829_07355 [Promineifilum sp.]|nr:hypothetical protein [Promineifilum sp.]HQF70307.1 hypothetical protein [Promineifilum sp.]
MHNGSERLAQDIAALSAMAAQMAEYLDSDILFWPLGHSSLPMLTLGGYLLREHRLLALPQLLTLEQRGQVDAAIFQFNQALSNRIVRFETKAQRELESRLRQWEESVREMEHGTLQRSSNYSTIVETRAMIQAVLDRLDMPPYRPDERSGRLVTLLDTRLRNRWQPGEFVWPAEWQPAYPRDDYWWLYGSPRVAKYSGND